MRMQARTSGMEQHGRAADPFADLVGEEQFFDPVYGNEEHRPAAAALRSTVSAVPPTAPAPGRVPGQRSSESGIAPSARSDAIVTPSRVSSTRAPGSDHRRVRSEDGPGLRASEGGASMLAERARVQSLRLPSTTPSADAVGLASSQTSHTRISQFFSPDSAATSTISAASVDKHWMAPAADPGGQGDGATSSDVRVYAVPRDESRHAAFLGIHALAEDAVYDEKQQERPDSGDESDASDSSTRVDAGAAKTQSSPGTVMHSRNRSADSAMGSSPLRASPAPTQHVGAFGATTRVGAAEDGAVKAGAPSETSMRHDVLGRAGAFRPPASKRSVVSSASVASAASDKRSEGSDAAGPDGSRAPVPSPLASAVAVGSDVSGPGSAPELPAPVPLEAPRRGLAGTWTALLRRMGWAAPALPPGLLPVTAVRRSQEELSRLVLVQRLPHFSTQVVRARVSKQKARLRAQLAAEEASASMIERRNSERSSSQSDSAGSRMSDRAGSTDNSSAAGRGAAGTHATSDGLSSGPGSAPSGLGGQQPSRPGTTVGDVASAIGGDNVSSVDNLSVGGTSITSSAGPQGSGKGSRTPLKLLSNSPLTEAIWTMKFSCDGQYLAVAGGSESGAILRVWKVRAWDAPAKPGKGGLTRPLVTHGGSLFERKPVREYLGHQSHIVDVAWSRSNLILSASMDSFVRLWHVSRSECLHKFQHPDCVTSVAFHPTEDNYFVTGCLDKKLRIWSLDTGRVVLWQPTASMITSVAFSPDARLVAVGLYNGLCTLYRSDGLRYHTTIECKNRKGKDRKGRKVTGLEFDAGGSYLLVSTNDSRLRLVSMDDFSQAYKYVGLRNNNMQIRATFDSSGDRIISGSEDRKVFVWRTRNDLVQSSSVKTGGRGRQKVHAYECFVGDDGVQPPSLVSRPTGGAAPSVWCGCGSAMAGIQAPDVAPRTGSVAAASLPTPADARVAERVADEPPGAEIDPDADDLEDRAELQAYYTSGRIATTVALFVPSATLALNRPLNSVTVWKCPPTLAPSAHDRFSGAVDIGEAAKIVRTYHVMVVAADSRGFIRVYENTAPRASL